MKVMFVRHGHSEANEHRILSNTGSKHPLTEKGHQQAKLLAERLSTTPIDRIYSSPLLRAEQTAETLAATVNAPVFITEQLAEYNMGELEDRSDEEAWDIYWKLSDDWLRRGLWNRQVPGGESMFMIRGRFNSFFDHLRLEPDDMTVAVVAHGGLYRCALPFALANVDFSFTVDNYLDNADVVVAERRGASFVCTDWAGRTVGRDEWLH